MHGIVNILWGGMVKEGLVLQQQDPGFDSRIGREAFLCGFCTFSQCLCWFPSAAPVSTTTKNTS